MRRLSLSVALSISICALIMIIPRTSFAAEYYSGKTLAMVVAGSPGGGTDIAGRVIGKHLGKFIPGKPAVIIRNMPAGGGILGANYVYSLAKPDGRTCLVGAGKNAVGSLVRVRGTKYDYKNMICVLAMPAGAVFMVNSDVLKKPEDIVKAKNLIFGGSALPSMTVTFTLLSENILRFKPEKQILAYRATAAARLAFMKGEITAHVETSLGYVDRAKSLVKKGEIVPIWQSGVINEAGDVVREPAVSELPTLKELHRQIYGTDPSGPEWRAFKMMVGVVATMSKSILFPPGAEKYAAIVGEAADKMVKDPGFIADMKKIAPGNPVYTGKQLKGLWSAAMKGANPQDVTWLRNWLNKEYGVALEP